MLGEQWLLLPPSLLWWWWWWFSSSLFPVLLVLAWDVFLLLDPVTDPHPWDGCWLGVPRGVASCFLLLGTHHFPCLHIFLPPLLNLSRPPSVASPAASPHHLTCWPHLQTPSPTRNILSCSRSLPTSWPLLTTTRLIYFSVSQQVALSFFSISYFTCSASWFPFSHFCLILSKKQLFLAFISFWKILHLWEASRMRWNGFCATYTPNPPHHTTQSL